MKPTRIPWARILTSQGTVTPEMTTYPYRGSGTDHEPYEITFLDKDPRDPMQFAPRLRWTLCLVVGYVTFSLAFISSAYLSGAAAIALELGGSPETNTLGLSFFVLGFVLGPLVWAPTSGKRLRR